MTAKAESCQCLLDPTSTFGSVTLETTLRSSLLAGRYANYQAYRVDHRCQTS